MRNTNNQEFETDYIFDNITVFGNVLLSTQAEHKPDLDKMENEAVKTNGRYIYKVFAIVIFTKNGLFNFSFSSFLIRGKKNYEDTLRCEDLVISELDEITVSSTLKEDVTATITSNKNFTNIILNGNVESVLNRLDKIDGIYVSEIVENLIMLDKPYKLDYLSFKNLKGEIFPICMFMFFLHA